jgi:hypothetical protein
MMKRTLSLAIAALLLAASGRAQNNGSIDINVRSGIDWPELERRKHDPAYAENPTRGHLYLLAHIQEEKTGLKLVRPVNAVALAHQLTRELEAHGFHAIGPKQKPDMIITVKYGRGRLPNPHSDNEADKERIGLSNSDSLQVWPTHDKYVGLEERRQRAGYEKLIIQVRAWEYPPPKDPKKKEVLLWMTTMFVDDPEHRDLNDISEKLLASGAPYFDRHIEREREVVINTPLPEGHVRVGSPEVVDRTKPN